MLHWTCTPVTRVDANIADPSRLDGDRQRDVRHTAKVVEMGGKSDKFLLRFRKPARRG